MDKYIGKLLNSRYEVLEVLGIGGMAVVYRAKCHVLNRFVAIKILKDEFANDEEFRRRFLNEGRAVAQLSHANIVSVYDVEQENGIQYIVMELIDGITLKDYMSKKGKLTWQETLFFAEQIAKALEHAHGRGVIHQDIKPHNVILLRDGTAKVTDFGIAYFETSMQETRIVQEAIGTVHYISPEQARGSSIDARTDLYSLGIVMYEMLTGKVPFDGDTPISIVMQHLDAVPKKPSELLEEIPQGMDDIVTRAMSPTVAKRYESARAIYEDLECLKFDPTMRFVKTEVRVAQHNMDETMVLSGLHETVAASEARAAVRKDERVLRFDQQSPQEYEKKRSIFQKLSESPVMLIVVALVVILGVSVAVFVSMWKGSSLSTKRADVPLLVGKQYDVVVSDTQYTEYFEIVQISVREDADAPQGEILEQQPSAGEKARHGSTIQVVVSSGISNTQPEIETYTLDDFSNRSLDFTTERLNRYGFDNIEIIEEGSFEIAEGNVIRTLPAAHTVVEVGTKITVYASTGTNNMMVEVPQLVGRRLDEASVILEASYLEVGRQIVTQSDRPAGEIVEQSVTAGTQVRVNSVIDIHVSSGPAIDEPDEEEPDDTTQQPSQGNATLRIDIPQNIEEAHVTVWLEEQVIYENVHQASDRQIKIPIVATVGTHQVTVRVEDDEWLETVVCE